ncbi:hypothetical protein K402DRAFT_463548 [Aulographum hederae CBS 113979]|uniref:Fungal N-terminal domain-containing protein n=1 Tax=Aulographum hederae CBS 113979 TaxID=1176131 RepID=A0A6G1H092_9PEZI|nr:hypothetical protein K402DRAFT_463548 [Aulographum hederae CBS 113979]
MDPLSLTVSLTSLLATSTKLISLANDLRAKYKSTALTMASIAAECSTVTVALTQLQMLIRGHDARYWRAGGREDVLKSVEAVALGVGCTLSVLEGFVEGLASEGEDAEREAKEKNLKGKELGRWEKAMFVFNEEEVKALLGQMRGYQSSLSLLLNVLQCQSDQEIRSMLHENRTVLALILRAVKDLDIDSITLSGMTIQLDGDIGALAIDDEKRLLEDVTDGSSASHNRSRPLAIEPTHHDDDDSDSDTIDGIADTLVIAGATTQTVHQPSEPTPSKPPKEKKQRSKPSISVAFNFFLNRKSSRPSRPPPYHLRIYPAITAALTVEPQPQDLTTPEITLNDEVRGKCHALLVGSWVSATAAIFGAISANTTAPEAIQSLYSVPFETCATSLPTPSSAEMTSHVPLAMDLIWRGDTYENDHLDRIFYPWADIIFICFSLLSYDSLDRAKVVFFDLVEHFRYVSRPTSKNDKNDKTPRPHMQIVLVGTRRIDPYHGKTLEEEVAKGKDWAVLPGEGEKVAREMEAWAYVEIADEKQDYKTVLEPVVWDFWRQEMEGK